jgi:tetratricopeptide (TPR) repeat protein
MEALVKDFRRIEYRKELVYFSGRLADLLVQAGRLVEAGKVHARTWQCCPDEPAAMNAYAWLLATCSDAAQRDPAQALTLAGKAVAAEPKNGAFQNTLAVAHYRSRNLKAAEGAFARAMQLRKGGDAFDWFFLAMICRQTGRESQARAFFERAICWTAKHAPENHELREFRREAEMVLSGTW